MYIEPNMYAIKFLNLQIKSEQQQRYRKYLKSNYFCYTKRLMYIHNINRNEY